MTSLQCTLASWCAARVLSAGTSHARDEPGDDGEAVQEAGRCTHEREIQELENNVAMVTAVTDSLKVRSNPRFSYCKYRILGHFTIFHVSAAIYNIVHISTLSTHNQFFYI